MMAVTTNVYLLLLMCLSLTLHVACKIQPFIDPGNGEICALIMSTGKDHVDQNYEHIDNNGRRCTCKLCHKGEVLKGNCSCDDPLQLRETLCDLVKKDQMMPYRNKCKTAINCTKCEHPWTVKSPCSRFGPDTECQCVDPDYYLVARDDCRPIPRCDKGYEPTARHGEDYTEMQCQPCRDGYYQPEDNSTNRCRKSRVCTVVASTIFSDAKCLNDPEPVLLPATTPGIEVMSDPQKESTTDPPSNVDMADINDAADGQDTASDGDMETTASDGDMETKPPGDKGMPLPPCIPFNGYRYSFTVLAAIMVGAVLGFFLHDKIKEYRPREDNEPPKLPVPNDVGEGVQVGNNPFAVVEDGVPVDNGERMEIEPLNPQ